MPLDGRRMPPWCAWRITRGQFRCGASESPEPVKITLQTRKSYIRSWPAHSTGRLTLGHSTRLWRSSISLRHGGT